MENLPHLILPLRTIVTLTFYLLVIVYIIFTTIFYYHWHSYSMSRSATITTYFAYFTISLPLISFMGLSLFAL